jgi:myo-inositol 2-dehydrogenase / D-chiro-inositol 1-dehydrogenase
MPESAVRVAPACGSGSVSPPVRVAVIGVGRIGRMHAELLAHRVPGLALAAVYDAVPDVAQTVGAALGADVPETVDELLSADDVEAVAICSSTPTHAPLIEQAARAGKAILCEKPVSLTLAEVDRALAAVRAAGVPFQIGFNRRFDPAHQAVRDAVAAGEVGDPHLARISSRDPAAPPLEYARVSGGLFLDMTVHDFDMARYVTGSEVTEVYATGGVRVTPGLREFGDIDTAVVTLTHENGCLTVIDNSRQAVYGYDQRVEVFGSAGAAASENPLAHTTVVRDAGGSRLAAMPYFFIERYTASYVRQWEAFAAAVRAGVMPPVSASDARAPLVIGLAALRSLRERRPVAVSEVGA